MGGSRRQQFRAEQLQADPVGAEHVLNPEARGAEETQMTQMETTQNRSNINPNYICNRPGIDPNSTENHAESTQNRHRAFGDCEAVG